MAKESERITLPPADPAALEQMKAAILAYVRLHPHATIVELEDNVQGFKGDDASWGKADSNLVMWDSLSFLGAQAISELGQARKLVLEPCDVLIYIMDGRWPTLPVAKRMPKGGFKSPHWVPLALALPIHELSPDVRRMYNQACQDKAIPIPTTTAPDVPTN
jgi:hypothetical protein